MTVMRAITSCSSGSQVSDLDRPVRVLPCGFKLPLNFFLVRAALVQIANWVVRKRGRMLCEIYAASTAFQSAGAALLLIRRRVSAN